MSRAFAGESAARSQERVEMRTKLISFSNAGHGLVHANV